MKEKDAQVQEGTGNPKQDEPKEAHTKTHHTYNIKDYRQSENFKSSRRKTVMLSKRELPQDCQVISQQKQFRPDRTGMKYSK